MKHAASRELYAYWDERRGQRPAPERAEIEPGAIRHALSDAFILALDRRAGHPFRLAGTRVCALFGRELAGEPFTGLWDEDSKAVMARLLAVLASESVGTVAGVTTQSSRGDTIELELLLLPLSADGPGCGRAIGVLAPLQVPLWLGAGPLAPLKLRGRRHVGATPQPGFLPRFMASRRNHLVVHQGGRASS
jgi:hypothetical protein